MAEEVSDIEKLAELSGTEKSAILMMLLGEEEAAQVLQNLTPKEVSTWVLRCIPWLGSIKLLLIWFWMNFSKLLKSKQAWG